MSRYLRCLVLATSLAACKNASSPSSDASNPADVGTPADLAAGDASPADIHAPADLPAEAANQIAGNVEGAPLVAKDAIFVLATASGLDFDGRSTDILLSDFPSACAQQNANKGVANGRMLWLGLAALDASKKATPVSTPGEYVVGKGPFAPSTLAAEVSYERDGADCLKQAMLEAASGKVTVTRVSADELQGTFDLTFDTTGEHVTGSFSAVSCASLDPNHTPLC